MTNALARPDVLTRTRLLLAAALLCAQLIYGGLPAEAQALTLTTSSWLPGPDASGSATYSGTVDQPSGASVTHLSGWVVDTTAQGWSGIDQVEIWDGLMQAGGRLVTRPAFQLDRLDVGRSLNNPFWSASGFAATLTATSLATGSVWYVYAHTPAKGWWYQQITTNLLDVQAAKRPVVNIETPTPLGTVHAAAPFTMRGYAFDAAAGSDQGAAVDRVQVYLNGDRSTGVYVGDAQLGRTDEFAAKVGTQFVMAGWQLTFQAQSWLNNLSDNQIVKLTAYARSSVTGAEAQEQTSIIVSVP